MTEIIKPTKYDPIVDLVINTLDSPHSRRMYAERLKHFLEWVEGSGYGFTKATVDAYRSELLEDKAPATVNLYITAIRRLAEEAYANRLIDDTTLHAIRNIKNAKASGNRTGNWLTKEAAQALVDLPDLETTKGLRDRAILFTLLGSGLRRQECADLTFAHIQMRENRWVFVDLIGKRNKMRTVPISPALKTAIDEWSRAAGVQTGRVFRSMRRGDNVVGDSMSAQAIFDVVKHYATILGVDARPHDLRRTFAKLALKGGSPTDQIQKSLGHDSIVTTERYLNIDQDLQDAPADHVGLR